VPQPILDATRAAFDVPGALVQKQKSLEQQPDAKLEPGREGNLQWGEPVNGLRAALIRPPALGLPEAGQSMDFSLVIQNVPRNLH
jgi:hypothetical protein